MMPTPATIARKILLRSSEVEPRAALHWALSDHALFIMLTCMIFYNIRRILLTIETDKYYRYDIMYREKHEI